MTAEKTAEKKTCSNCGKPIDHDYWWSACTKCLTHDHRDRNPNDLPAINCSIGPDEGIAR